MLNVSQAVILLIKRPFNEFNQSTVHYRVYSDWVFFTTKDFFFEAVPPLTLVGNRLPGKFFSYYTWLVIDIHFFFYKNLVYKNVKASNGPKIKNILRTYKGFKS